jgi:hypothetical protein
MARKTKAQKEAEAAALAAADNAPADEAQAAPEAAAAVEEPAQKPVKTKGRAKPPTRYSKFQ